jgi:hypothetical protein
VSVLRNNIGFWLRAWAAAMLLPLLVGCAHGPKVPPLPPQAKTPSVYLPPPPESRLPPMESTQPIPNLIDAKPAEATQAKPKRHSKRQPAASETHDAQPANASPAPVVPASTATPAPAESLGALSAGGGAADPKQHQEVAAHIAAVEKRVAELPRAVTDRQEKPIANVRLFLKEATDALKSGDVEGAGILATKAELLLDDIAR